MVGKLVRFAREIGNPEKEVAAQGETGSVLTGSSVPDTCWRGIGRRFWHDTSRTRMVLLLSRQSINSST